METVNASSGHGARCRRFREIDWEAAKPTRKPMKSAPLGPIVLEVDRLKKYYELTDSSLMAMVKGTKARTVKANESRFHCPRIARRWRSSAKSAAASRPSPR